MYAEMFEKTNSQMEQVLNPMRKAQGTMLDHFAKVADFQVEAMKHYSDLSIQNLRALKDVNDAQSLQAYVSKQTEVAKSLGEKVSADVSEFVKLQRGFAEEMQKLAQDGVANATPEAVKQAQKSAATANSNSSAAKKNA